MKEAVGLGLFLQVLSAVGVQEEHRSQAVAVDRFGVDRLVNVPNHEEGPPALITEVRDRAKEAERRAAVKSSKAGTLKLEQSKSHAADVNLLEDRRATEASRKALAAPEALRSSRVPEPARRTPGGPAEGLLLLVRVAGKMRAEDVIVDMIDGLGDKAETTLPGPT